MSTPPVVNALFTSHGARTVRRTLGALPRRLFGKPATLHYFHQCDDPYSHLLLLALPDLLARYRVTLVMHVVPPPGDAAAPDRERLTDWSRCDADELAQVAVSPAPTSRLFATQPDAHSVERAQSAMIALLDSNTDTTALLAAATRISTALWAGDTAALDACPAATATRTAEALQMADALRVRYGHYLGGTLYFEREWYWGIDRLHYLERRLFDSGLSTIPEFALIRPLPALQLGPRRAANGTPPVLHFFCSLRSPYTYLAVERCALLAKHYGAELRLRFVLPMVMRGLPVPKEKRMYIVLDTKREADSLGLPFGRIADPVGAPTERGLAVLHRAIGADKGLAFLESFMRGVWAEGVDAGDDASLNALAARAGLDAAFVADALRDDSWRAVAQTNRDEMLAAGLWGVPSFRVNEGSARWGQDRLWRVERDLQVLEKTS